MKDKEETKKHNTVASEYEKLKTYRQPYVDKAKEAARYTIPSLLTDEHYINLKSGQYVKHMKQPNQSVGADGINNLAAKVTLTMLPPNQTFFKFALDTMNSEKQDSQYWQDVNRALSLIEKMLLDYQEQTGDRVCLGEALKHLYVTGNVFLLHDPKDGLRMYPITRYCVKRDYSGNVLKAITEEKIAFSALDEKIQELIRVKILETKGEKECEHLDEKEFTLYTCFKRNKKHWLVFQEVEGIKIPESEGKYPIEICPFMALRYTRIDGESYGRSLVEEYIGDISYLDTISLAIKQTSLAAAKLLMLVNPTGMTKIKNLTEAENGDFVLGRPDDVQPLQANKYYDLQTAKDVQEEITRRLNRVFIVKQAIQRDAERVTAEEIRQMVSDLEESQGNHYAILCKEFQLAYVKITFFHMKKQHGDALPDLVRDKNVKLTVTTGLEALGRTSDLNKWATFFDVIAKFAQSAQVIGAKTDVIAQIVATSLNLDTTGIFPTEEEKQQMMQQQQQAALAEKVAPNVVNKYGDMMLQQQQAQQQQEG